MFEAMLEQLCRQRPLPGQFQWISSMEGVRVCDFTCALPARLILENETAKHYEALFCRQGGLRIDWTDGHHVSLGEREILLLSDLSKIQSISRIKEPMGGILIAVNAPQARGSLSQLCTLMGGLELDTLRVKELMCCQQGCMVIPQTSWSEVIFRTCKGLTVEQRGRYCTFMAVELLYLLSSGSQPLPRKIPCSYLDSHQLNVARQANTYILTHLDEALTIDQLTQILCVSSTLLKTSFRQLYGQPIRKYIQECRMRRAAELLSTTRQSVLDISISVGYGSVSQFGALFKRFYQVTPSQYRRKAEEKLSNPVDFCPNQEDKTDANPL